MHTTVFVKERTKAEQAIQESEQRYKRLLASVTDYVYSVTVDHGRPSATVHGPGYSGGKGIGERYILTEGKRFADDFHVYSVVWNPDNLEFFMDGKSYHKLAKSGIPDGTEWVFDHPFFIILNVAVGGQWPGNPDESSRFPQQMLVDYVRVYQAQ